MGVVQDRKTMAVIARKLMALECTEVKMEERGEERRGEERTGRDGRGDRNFQCPPCPCSSFRL